VPRPGTRAPRDLSGPALAEFVWLVGPQPLKFRNRPGMEFTDHKSPANNPQTTTPPPPRPFASSSPPSHLTCCCIQPQRIAFLWATFAIALAFLLDCSAARLHEHQRPTWLSRTRQPRRASCLPRQLHIIGTARPASPPSTHLLYRQHVGVNYCHTYRRLSIAWSSLQHSSLCSGRARSSVPPALWPRHGSRPTKSARSPRCRSCSTICKTAWTQLSLPMTRLLPSA